MALWRLKQFDLLDQFDEGLFYEIFDHNPLAAAFVLARSVRYKGIGFAPEIFYKNIFNVFNDRELPSQLQLLKSRQSN